MGSAAEKTTLEYSSSPLSSATPAARARPELVEGPLTMTCATELLTSDLGPKRFRRAGDGTTDPAGAAFGKAPGAEGTVDLAHVVMQQHVGRPR